MSILKSIHHKKGEGEGVVGHCNITCSITTITWLGSKSW